MATERNWKMRETRPDCWHLIPEELLTVNLTITRSGGVVERLGKYRINVRDLADRGFANHAADGQFTVRINHVNGRDFNLGTRVGQTTPLAPFRVT